MAESQRVLSGSITKGSMISPSGSHWDQTRQGVEIRTYGHLTQYTQAKIRVNTDFITLVDGRPRNVEYFDETLAPEPIGVGPISGTVSGTVSTPHRSIRMDNHVKLDIAPSHYARIQDFGYPTFFTPNDELAYTEADDERLPVRILSTHPAAMVLPLSLFHLSSMDNMNGVIEPLEIRRVADRTTTERPFAAHSIWASMGHDIDPERRSIVVTNRIPIQKSARIEPYLDSPIYDEAWPGIVPNPPALSEHNNYIRPYVDGDDSSDKTAPLAAVQSDQLRLAVEAMAPTGGDMTMRNHVLSTSGFVYDNAELGIDSIAYGGRKK
jgi:hypothetical protein